MAVTIHQQKLYYIGTTTLFPVNDSLYGTDTLYVLDSNDGKNFSSAYIYFIDDHTIRVYSSMSSNSGRTHFAITSIKGIK